jgi:hypothetical protein
MHCNPIDTDWISSGLKHCITLTMRTLLTKCDLSRSSGMSINQLPSLDWPIHNDTVALRYDV